MQVAIVNQSALSALSIALPLNKKGEVSKATEKAGRLLSENRGALLGAAIHGTGQVGRVARATLSHVAPTVAAYLSREMLDGSEWGALLAQLCAEFGMANYSEGSKGKAGCVRFAENMVTEAALKFGRSETAKQYERAQAAIHTAESVRANVARLVAAADAARVAAEAAAGADQVAAA